MKETPIIMSGNHLKLILDGIKTMTRRVLKPQPFNQALIPSLVTPDTWGWFKDDRKDLPEGRLFKCPYGQVGDRLWVRETFLVDSYGKLFYRADEEVFHPEWYKWTPSIHMPRWASRITLEITEVRVERVQEISDKDCIAEEHGYGWEVNPWVWVIGFRVIR